MPIFSSAVVPLRVAESRVTLTLTFNGLMLVASHSCRIVIRFIILVSDATSLRLKLPLPVIKRYYRI
jgi:hypothetical protein